MKPTGRSTPTAAHLILTAVEAGVGQICTGLPARVESYDAAKQRCSAQPLVQRVFRDEDGNQVAERLPVISDVPVCFPGAGPWRLTFPIAAGDTVWLMFSQASLDLWLARGGEVDPEDARHHHLSDAVALAGVRDFAHALSGVSGSSMVLGGPSVNVEITGSEVRAGGSAALATKADIDALKTWAAAHVHTGVTTGPGSSGPPGVSPPAATGTVVLKGS